MTLVPAPRVPSEPMTACAAHHAPAGLLRLLGGLRTVLARGCVCGPVLVWPIVWPVAHHRKGPA